MGETETVEERPDGGGDLDLESSQTDAGAQEGQMAEAAIIPEESSVQDGGGDSIEAADQASPDEGEVDGADGGAKGRSLLSRLFLKSKVLNVWASVQRHGGFSLGVFIGIALVASSAVLKWETTREQTSPPPAPVQTYFSPAVSELTEIVNFEGFILFPMEVDKAYLSVSISAKTMDESVYREINERKTWYRSVVYDILTDSVTDASLSERKREEVARSILRALNDALGRDGVEEIVFGHVLKV